MSASDKNYLNLGMYGRTEGEKLCKIADMKKQSSLISPFAILFCELFTGSVSTFGVCSIINRKEGIWAGIKNLGPGAMGIKMYYKESGDTLSVYAYIPSYHTILPIFINARGTVNGFVFEQQSSTDTSGMTQFTVAS